ncbi:sensor histidine kinase [Pseudoroseicyclus tamaricis]|uniref:histidine kinase n=1 Tax=Pseudoroseicyclus tamaricis TaxID=2705421 RepID=A0A6B2JUM7_9RHOB|nr:sensor histidine kinase [Pseudoroseicyclus tamaricis]NDV02227.1 histidine kinase [Pseudoroseicyclus tamaricis]
MTTAPKVDVRDLGSVRRAAETTARKRAERNVILLGDDWVDPEVGEREMQEWRRRRRGVITLKRSPLARKIITFNLVALILLVTGMLYFAPSRANLAFQRASGLVAEAELIADMFQLRADIAASSDGEGAFGASDVLDRLDLRRGVTVWVFDAQGQVVGQAAAGEPEAVQGLEYEGGGTLITNALSSAWDGLARLVAPGTADEPAAPQVPAGLVEQALAGRGAVSDMRDGDGNSIFAVASPILQAGTTIGAVGVTSAPGEIDALLRIERERVLQMFVVGIIVSIALSLVLASTIANPLAELAAAAEIGRDKNARKMAPSRVRIPDLSARPDEIGRLSSALRGMVAALYDRIEGNEQFAADVAHEIKNPLASLRSAMGTMRVAKREDQREKLIEVMEHDVRRLDRLVSDISAASRLDAELVKEEEETFDLLRMLTNLNEHLGGDARRQGIDYITDLPPGPITLSGLEGRLAQVFVNIITNAVSFCEEGDAIRVWARRRENRVLVVVEDTGPGIPEEALTKIFQRFYSQRPEQQFGNNSGLGLAISKQIVEAHGGVIWAENIRPTDADPTSEPLGARFVVGLPV